MLSSWFSWLAAVVIIAVVSVACRFAEDRPRNDEPPDTGGDGRSPALRTA